MQRGEIRESGDQSRGELKRLVLFRRQVKPGQMAFNMAAPRHVPVDLVLKVWSA